MRTLFFMFLLTSTLFSVAQEAVTSDGDKDLANLIAKVEGTPTGGKYTCNFKAQEGNLKEEEVAAFSERYFTALLTEDLTATYQMMSKDYREAVTLQSYLKKDHVKLLKVDVDGFQFVGDTCARIMGKTRGSAGRIGQLDLPLRLRIFKEDGNWVVYSNPYEQMGFNLPNAKTIKYPCEF